MILCKLPVFAGELVAQVEQGDEGPELRVSLSDEINEGFASAFVAPETAREFARHLNAYADKQDGGAS